MTAFKKINLPTRVPVDDTDFLKFLSERDQNLSSILDRGIAFAENVDCRVDSFSSSGTPNAENTVAHGLGKVPTGYIVIGLDKAAIVYTGATAWTSTNIYLKVNTASVAVKIIVF